MRRAVFLDRDGTLCVEIREHLRDPSQIQLLPGVRAALRRLRRSGFLLIVVTNQSGVARGYFSEERLAVIHRAFQAVFNKAGVRFAGIFYCPHLPGGAVPAYARRCDCRKPEPGLILRAAAEHGVDLPASFLVGDKPSDIQAGRAAGCRTVLLTADGDGPPRGDEPPVEADFRAAGWRAAADWILGTEVR